MLTLTWLTVGLKQGWTQQCWKVYSCLYKDSDRTHILKRKKKSLPNEVVHIINNLHVGHALRQGLAASTSEDIACCLIHIFEETVLAACE